MTTVGTAHTGEPLVQIATFQIFAYNVVDNCPPVAKSLGKSMLVFPFECHIMFIEQFP